LDRGHYLSSFQPIGGGRDDGGFSLDGVRQSSTGQPISGSGGCVDNDAPPSPSTAASCSPPMPPSSPEARPNPYT